MTPAVDVAVVGGGPAGLAVAALSARQGLSVVLLERAALPHDKACGEGVMAGGLAVLERLGVRDRIPASDSGPIRGVRYVQEDGSVLEGALPGSGGLGIRRTALSSVLLEAARAAGAEVHDRTALRSHHRTAEAMVLDTDAGEISARVLVAADGLHSPLRRAEGLEVPTDGPRRFGVRQHFQCTPWTDRVEVHLSTRAEAYVTPCGPSRVGVAFLWSDGQLETRPSVTSLLARFGVLGPRLAGAPTDSEPLGAGPFLQRAPVSPKSCAGKGTRARSGRTWPLLAGSSGSTPGPQGRCSSWRGGRRSGITSSAASRLAPGRSSGSWPTRWADPPSPHGTGDGAARPRARSSSWRSAGFTRCASNPARSARARS